VEEANSPKGGVAVGNFRPLLGSTPKAFSLSERKRLFLSSLRSRGGGGSKYRRYLGAPIRYPGGKSYAVGYIVELLLSVRRRLAELAR